MVVCAVIDGDVGSTPTSTRIFVPTFYLVKMLKTEPKACWLSLVRL
jgi:hypothetical protein